MTTVVLILLAGAIVLSLYLERRNLLLERALEAVLDHFEPTVEAEGRYSLADAEGMEIVVTEDLADRIDEARDLLNDDGEDE